MLIMILFQKFIVYIMNNLCAKFGCHISSNNRDKQGGGIRSPQALSVSNHPGQIGLRQTFFMRVGTAIVFGYNGMSSCTLGLYRPFQRGLGLHATFLEDGEYEGILSQR